MKSHISKAIIFLLTAIFAIVPVASFAEEQTSVATKPEMAFTEDQAAASLTHEMSIAKEQSEASISSEMTYSDENDDGLFDSEIAQDEAVIDAYTSNSISEANPLSIEESAVSESIGITVNDGDKLKADNYYSKKTTVYSTPVLDSTNGFIQRDTSYYFDMPAKGAFVLTVQNYGYVTKGDAFISGESTKVVLTNKITDSATGSVQYICAATKKGRIKVNQIQDMRYGGTGYTSFNAFYVLDTVNTLKAKTSGWTEYMHGTTADPTKAANFKVKVPANGYLIMELFDVTGTSSSIAMKTIGFKNPETFDISNVQKCIGVKKGTYTFNVKTSAAIYGIRIKMVKVSEGKYGTTKAKAAALKKNSVRKGLIITNGKVSKKTHWYKFKNPKNQNVSVQVDTKMNGGGNYSTIQVTIYNKSKVIANKTIHPDEATTTFTLSTSALYGKLKKGTYHIRIKNVKGGNGYFTVKWS